MKKKVLSFILALSMILGSMGMTFAAPAVFEDVDDSNVAKAVERLKAFKIVDGYEDGTYRPGQEVTREEFAKFLVTALGIDHAASSVTVADYKDVEAGRWSAGYIAVASGQGLIIGDPDGNFRPADKVSYAEAVTMLVRSLGYKDEFLKGTWPGNSVAKAAEVGITSTVRFTNAEGYANRGEVAVLVNNTLDSDVVKVNTYKDGTTEYFESDVTLLKDRLDISKYEEVRIIADKILDDGLLEDEVNVLFTKDVTSKDDSVKKSYYKGDNKDFTFEEGVNPRVLMGEKVTAYLNDNEDIIYIESEDDDRVQFDYVFEVKNDTEVSLVKLDKAYKFDKDAYVHIYDDSKDSYEGLRGDQLDTKAEIDAWDLPGSVGKFVIKNNKVIFAEIFKSSEVQPLFVALKNDKGELEGINKDTEDYILDLREDGTYDFALVYDINGNKIDVEDIEKGNVLYAQLLDYDGDDVALVRVVTDNKLEGEVGRFREDRVQIDGSYKVAVKQKDSALMYDAYYTINTLEDIERWNGTDWETDFDDAYGEDAVVYLDAVGRIAFLRTDVESTSGYKYGVVTRTYADGDRVKIYTSLDGEKGEDITFKADRESDLTNPRLIEYKDGKFEIATKGSAQNILGAAVQFRLNRDGEIDKNEFYMMDRAALFAMNADFGRDSMRVKTVKDGKATSFSTKDNVSIIDAEGLDPSNSALVKDYRGDLESLTGLDVDDFDAVRWEDMRNTKEADDIRFYVFPRKDKHEEVGGLVFVGDRGANTASDREAIYVRDRWRQGDDIIIEYIAFGSDERKTGTVDGVTDLVKVTRRAPYVAEIRSNGKIKLLGHKAVDGDEVKDKDSLFTFVNGEVEKITGSRLTVNGETYTIGNDAVVYDGGDKKSTSNIKVGEGIMAIVEDNIRVRVVQLDVDVKEKGDNGDVGKLGDLEVSGLENDNQYAAFGQNTLTGKLVRDKVEDFSEYLITVYGKDKELGNANANTDGDFTVDYTPDELLELFGGYTYKVTLDGKLLREGEIK